MDATSRGADRRTALGITAIYFAVGALWIIFSDRFVASLVGDGAPGSSGTADLTRLQSIKGIIFIVGSSVLLYVLITRGIAAIHEANRRAQEQSLSDAARYRNLIDRTSDEAQRSQLEHQHLEEQLRQSQKMEAIGLLAGGVAHDFNNVLTAIMGYGELALARLAPDDPARAEIDNIHLAAERAGGLTRQLLAFSRKQVLKARPVDLNAVLIDMGRMLPRVLGEQIELELVPDTLPATVLADLSQIEQVILNLCVNARDAMPRGGRLRLEISRAAGPPAAQGAAPTTAPAVLLTVTDSGQGMDDATRARIFEPFFTTKAAGHGTGLGLSTVYGIVQQTGGSIRCESAPGRGTTFFIELPLVAGTLPNDDSTTLLSVRGNETLLLVEDDDCVREMAELSLSRLGYAVLAARDVRSAEAALEAHAGQVHLLIADVILPDSGGSAFAARLRTTRPGLKVLLLSGHDASVAPPASSGEPVLVKPFTAPALALAVRRTLDAPQGIVSPRVMRTPERRPASAAGTVLVVDDDPHICSVLGDMLRNAGYEALVASDGAKALAMLKTTTVDLVLCDMLMPNKEGIETCAELKRTHPGLPFLAMSGAPGGSNYLRIVARLGAVGGLTKPFSGQELITAVTGALSARTDSAATRKPAAPV